MSSTAKSPSAPNTFAQNISGVLHGLGRTRTKDTATTETSTNSTKDRSRSRGRDPLISTGRGGAGNIVPSPERGGPDAGDLATIAQNRERSASRIRSSGRGGAGNVINPEDEIPVSAADKDLEASVFKKHAAEVATAVHSSGRGGAGNISSRSPSRNPGERSPSRGRLADFLPGSRSTSQARSLSASRGAGVAPVQSLDGAAVELDKPAHHVPATHFSTGRGGLGNQVEGTEPPVEASLHQPGGITSSGRGGAGNINL